MPKSSNKPTTVVKSTKRSKKGGNTFPSMSMPPSPTLLPPSKSSKKSKGAIGILHKSGLFQGESFDFGEQNSKTAKSIIHSCIDQCSYQKGKSGRKSVKGKSGKKGKSGASKTVTMGKSGSGKSSATTGKSGVKGKSGTVSKGKGSKAVGIKSKGKGSISSKSSKNGGPVVQSNECCKGGVSYLKFSYEGITPGILSTSYIDNVCSEWIDFNNYFMGSSSYDPKFIKCDELCLTSLNCTIETASETTLVSTSGEEICLISWDAILDQPAPEYKFPDSLSLFFAPSLQANNSVYHVSIDTSCGSPIYPPHAAVLKNICEMEGSNIMNSTLLNYMEIDAFDLPILKFLDGISPEFVTTMDDYPISSFAPTFADCSCNCDPEPEKSDCELECESYMAISCSQEGKYGYEPCNVDSFDRRLVTSEIIVLPVDEQMLYHENMVQTIQRKLSEF